MERNFISPYPDLLSLPRNWVQGFCPLNMIEQTLSSLIDERTSKGVQRIATIMKAEEAVAMLEPGDCLIGCSGRMIQHNKDLFESLDDAPALLNLLQIYQHRAVRLSAN